MSRWVRAEWSAVAMALSVNLLFVFVRVQGVRVQGGWQHSADQHLDELLKAFAHYWGESNKAPVVWTCDLALFWYWDDD